jgi:hypothetical protein
MPFDNWEVERIDLEVPAGPSGAMGFVLANNGVPWIPRSPGEWLVWDDHSEAFPVTGYPTASGWQIVGYNVGFDSHVVVCRFHVNAIQVGSDQSVPLPAITFIERDVVRDEVVL